MRASNVIMTTAAREYVELVRVIMEEWKVAHEQIVRNARTVNENRTSIQILKRNLGSETDLSMIEHQISALHIESCKQVAAINVLCEKLKVEKNKCLEILELVQTLYSDIRKTTLDVGSVEGKPNNDTASINASKLLYSDFCTVKVHDVRKYPETERNTDLDIGVHGATPLFAENGSLHAEIAHYVDKGL